MTLGAIANSRRRSAAAPANVILNGTFSSNTIWTGVGFSGKTISGGTANFVASPTFDGFGQAVTLTVGSYYELTWTISGRTAGTVRPQISGGAGVLGTDRSTNGTFQERLLIPAGANNFLFQLSVTGTLSVDNLSLIGPYTTSTVGGA